MKPLYPELELADNVLQNKFIDINSNLHPVGVILNAGGIESTGGDFLFYSQGVTPAIAQVIAEIDGERVELMGKADLKRIRLVGLLYRYRFSSVGSNSSVLESIRSSSAISEIRSPNSLNHRDLLEDVGQGLVPMSLIATIFGAKTQNIDSLINLAWPLNKIDHWEKGMTLEKVGSWRSDMINLYSDNGTNSL